MSVNENSRILYNLKNGKISFGLIASLYLFSYFILPSYFGVRLFFFDMTATRLLLILVCYGIWKNPQRYSCFVGMCKVNKSNFLFYLFWFVMLYTNILRRSVNGIFLILIDVFIATMVIWYLVKYEYGVVNILGKIRFYSWILGVCGIVEGITGKSLFSLLNVLEKGGGTTERFGTMRISGPCTNSNGYGLYLLILLALVCIDYERNKIDILKNKWLVMILMLNIFFTGTRLALGIGLIEFALLVIVSERSKLPRLLAFIGIIIVMVGGFVTVFPGLEISRTILRSLFQVVDVFMGTTYADAYGSNSAALYGSNYYRTLLLRIFSLDYLNPWLGRGVSYHFSYATEGYWIESIDNYYIVLYVFYGYPGLISFILMSLAMVGRIIKFLLVKIRAVCLAAGIAIICYYGGLWYLDQLQTFKYMYMVFVLVLCEWDNIKRNSKRSWND